MALTDRETDRFVQALNGLKFGPWEAYVEDGGHAGEFVMVNHPGLGENVTIAATPNWDATDVLAIEYQDHGPGAYRRQDYQCNRVVPVAWSGSLGRDKKLWIKHVSDFLRCVTAAGAPLSHIDAFPASMREPVVDWDAGAKARQAEIFRHMLGLDDNPDGKPLPKLYRRTSSHSDGGFWTGYYTQEPTAKTKAVAAIAVHRAQRRTLVPDCRADLEELERLAGRRLKPFEIYDVEIYDTRLSQRGLGVLMYRNAVQHLKKIDGALLASRCYEYLREYTDYTEEATSPRAEQVWRSKRLADAVTVSGFAATAVGAVNPVEQVKARLLAY